LTASSTVAIQSASFAVTVLEREGTMAKERRRLSKQQKEVKLMEWERRRRRVLAKPVKVPRSQIARLDAETIAIDRRYFDDAIKLIRENGFVFWQMGP